MKKFLKIALILALIILLVAGGYFIAINLTKKQALESIDKMFTAIKTGDKEQIKQYINIDDSEEETETNEENTDKNEEMEKIMLKKLNYEVVSTDAKLNVSNKDLKTVFQNYITKAFSLAFSQAFSGTTEEEMDNQLNQYLEEQYNSDSIQTITSEVTINMKKEKGKWNVNCDENEIVNAVLPGYKEVVEAMNNVEE